MNNKGELLVEETLKMIISVIAISFLVFFLVSLYFSKAQGDELIQAQADINQLSRDIKAGTSHTELNNPVGWSLFSFVEEPIPNACAKEKCLCICDNVFWSRIKLWKTKSELQYEECNKNGACVAVKNLEAFAPLEIDSQVTKILINTDGGKVILSK